MFPPPDGARGGLSGVWGQGLRQALRGALLRRVPGLLQALHQEAQEQVSRFQENSTHVKFHPTID